jgi:hypothetical protein
MSATTLETAVKQNKYDKLKDVENALSSLRKILQSFRFTMKTNLK